MVTLPGTYQTLDKKPLGPHWLLIAPIRGFQDGALIIFLIFIFGGAFAILGRTGAIEAGIQRLARFFSRKPRSKKFVIPVLMIVFSLAGGIYGMAEESIPFVLIFIPLALSLGYDSIVGVAIPFLGSAVGLLRGLLQPLYGRNRPGIVGPARFIPACPTGSILWVIATTIAIIFVMIYAARITKDPHEEPGLRNRSKPGLRAFADAAASASLWGSAAEAHPPCPRLGDSRCSSMGSWPRAGIWRRSPPFFSASD